MNTPINQTGTSFLKTLGWLVATPVILIVLGVAFTESNKAYWDHRVKQMCEKDGGVTIFEKVELTKEEYGNLNIQFKQTSKPDSTYYRVSLEDVVMNENPLVWKDGQKIIRRSDEKVLGIQISYGRRGGDIPTGISEPSHYGCEQVEGINLSLTKSIFLTKGE